MNLISWTMQHLRERDRAIAKAIAKQMSSETYVIVGTADGPCMIRLSPKAQPAKNQHDDNINNKPIPRRSNRRSYRRR